MSDEFMDQNKEKRIMMSKLKLSEKVEMVMEERELARKRKIEAMIKK